MFNKPQLSISEVRAAMKAMLDHCAKQPDRPVVLAIVDDMGDLLAYARTDNCMQRPMKAAIEKAYTAAAFGQTSREFGDRIMQEGRTVGSFRDPNLTAGQGGAPIKAPGDGTLLGGVGVSGLRPQEDEDLALLGIEAMGLDKA